MRPFIWLTAAITLLQLSAARAQETYSRISLSELEITEGDFLKPPPDGTRYVFNMPRVVPDDPAIEAYILTGGQGIWQSTRELSSFDLVICAPRPGEVTGTLVVSNLGGEPGRRLRFKVNPDRFPSDRHAFLEGKINHYRILLERQTPGGAWFRAQIRQAERELALRETNPVAPIRRAPVSRRNELDNTFALFGGGRAISENLQLDRPLPLTTRQPGEMVNLDTLSGITVAEMDWTALIKDLKPELDPLADVIPADQHAIFFPTFDSAVKLTDSAQQHGSLLLIGSSSRSEDALTQQRYERQLGLSLSGLGRLLGPQLVNSVAVTGSDPYLRVGSDVTILFEARNAEVLATLLAAQTALAQRNTPAAQSVSGSIDGIPYRGALSPDRAISTYMMTLSNAVVVTNSTAQLQRIIATFKKQTPALSSLPEYVFFRDRYRRGDASETAMLILSDATIRRWCGPKWRIADSRRTRAAAVMSDLQAQHASEIVGGNVVDQAVLPDMIVPDLGDVRLTRSGIVSRGYGSLDFMTPISELEIQQVTRDEATAYGRWSTSYQTNWRGVFDPIALRFSLKDNKIGLDLSVMPLIAGTDFRNFIAITRDAALKPSSGDPHNTIGHLALAINPDTDMIRSYGRTLQNVSGNLRIEPLAWLGSSVAIYADDDPFWSEMVAAERPEDFLSKNSDRLPVALYAESRDSFRLAAFLTAFRAFAEQASPGLTKWEILNHGEIPYVKVSATQNGPQVETLAIYYAALPKALIVSPNEQVLKRAMDRQASNAPSTQPTTQPTPTWLGRSVAVHLDSRMIQAFSRYWRSDAVTDGHAQAWWNIPILNEWKRLYPDKDPVQVHETLFGTRLLDPAGGKYVWNEQWRTMESTIYGHPAMPKAGPALFRLLGDFSGDFGLTFENQGLRARVEIEEAPRKPEPGR